MHCIDHQGQHYAGRHLEHLAFPMGGIGAGMMAIQGNGRLSHFSFRHRPNFLAEPLVFSALCIKGAKPQAKILEGPLPERLIRGRSQGGVNSWIGMNSVRLPRFHRCSFTGHFPFGQVDLEDDDIPLNVSVSGWSPFIPGDSEHSSLPMAGLRISVSNPTEKPVEAVYSFHAQNLMNNGNIRRGATDGSSVSTQTQGFTLSQAGSSERPWDEGHFTARIDDPDLCVDAAWPRGSWSDSLLLLWRDIASGALIQRPPHESGNIGASLYLPISLAPGESREINLQLSWYVPDSGYHVKDWAMPEPSAERPSYKPWYATRFSSHEALADYWQEHHDSLLRRSLCFSEHLHHSSLPPEITEAISANLGIITSTTIMRQSDGRIWCWEGSYDEGHFCHGSCTHVWNYAQAIAHLFPDLERGLRETEFSEALQDDGCQSMRVDLPIRPTGFVLGWALRKGLPEPAADGQFGGIIKTYRDWRISGDQNWLRSLWPQIKKSLDFCIDHWDPRRTGLPEEPQHNTYDIEFWGPNGMIGSFCLAALKAACRMGQAIGEDITDYETLYRKGRSRMETKLWDGEYFIQKIMCDELTIEHPTAWVHHDGTPVEKSELHDLLKTEGPKYQYGAGCLSDGVLGAWMAAAAGLDDIIDEAKIRSHLLAVHRYNLRHNLLGNIGTIDGDCGKESGLLTCTWPKGGKPTIPVVYDFEVWPGIEYQVASHLIMLGCVDEGLDIVRCVRKRFDGCYANPYNETEHPGFYGRILSSYALLQAYSGIRYDAIDKTLTINPKTKGDCRFFFATDGAWGSIGIQNGKPFIDLAEGNLAIDHITINTPD